MEREIKFRAWDEKLCIMLTEDKEKEIGDQWEAFWEIPSAKGGVVTYPDGVLMQFTGLCDSKGTEIYEGDIVELYRTSAKREVIYVKGTFCARTPHVITMLYKLEPEEIEVIGNIYENPEYLNTHN